MAFLNCFHGLTACFKIFKRAISFLVSGVILYGVHNMCQGQGLQITEFMALNESTLQDEDGAYSDWLEIFNAGSTPVFLGDYALSDDETLEEFWMLPGRTIEPGEYLMIFASGKDRAPVEGELHANFRLSAEGEYLGLLGPNGIPVFEFRPAFPAQTADVSYGLSTITAGDILVSPQTPARFNVPEGPSEDTTWFRPDFDDSGWGTATASLGYARPLSADEIDEESLPLEDVTRSNDEVVPTSLNSPGSEMSPNAIDDNIDTKYLNFDKFDTGFDVSPSTGPSVVKGLRLTSANDAPGRDPATFILSGSNDGANYIEIASGNVPAFEARFEEVEILFENERSFTSYRLRFPTVVDPPGANSMQIAEVAFLGRGGAGVVLPVYAGRIVTSIEEAMFNLNTSVRGRVPFLVNDPGTIGKLELVIEYDDGFVAFLNGEEVLRRGFTGALTWDSMAVTDRAASEAAEVEFVDVSEFIPLLVHGENLFSFQGLTHESGASGFLFNPVLAASAGETEGFAFMTSPTPGTRNTPGDAGILSAVQFSHSSGLFTEPFELALSHDEPGASIHYTLDGSLPDEDSALYARPLVVDQNTILRAMAFKPGFVSELPSTVSFTRLQDNLLSFSSNLPVVVVDNFGRGRFPSSSSLDAFLTMFEPGEGGRTQWDNEPTLTTRSALKIRGSSTAGREKASYTVELRDEFGEDKDVEVLGFSEESDWILYGAYNFDRALMRNAFIYDLSNQVGRYATRSRFVELFVVDDSNPLSMQHYAGVYSWMEKIKRGNDRVDVEGLDPSDVEVPAVTGGYMLKIDRPDPGDSGFSVGSNSRYAQSLRYVDPKEEEIELPERDPQEQYIRGFMNDFVQSLAGNDFADPETGFRQFIDVDGWIDHHLLNVLAKNVDALRLSTYMYKPRNGRLVMGPIWDFDRAMDSYDGRDDNPETWNGTGDGTRYFEYIWWERLFEDPEFWQQYRDRWFELRKGPFSEENIHAIIDGMAAELVEAQERNFQRWNLSLRSGTWEAEVDHLKDWLSRRLVWIDSQFPSPPRMNTDTAVVDPGFSLILSAPTEESFERLNLVPDSEPIHARVPESDIGMDWIGAGNDPGTEWLVGPQGVGYERGSGYEPFIGLNLDAPLNNQTAQSMYGQHESVYIRIPVHVETLPGSEDSLSLEIRYDDGFVAWLNGVRVADANVPSNLSWNSGATTTHNDGEAVQFQSFDLSDHKGLLQLGDENLLAIQGLNSGITSSDFLIHAELHILRPMVHASAPIYYTYDGSDPRLPGGEIRESALRVEGPLVILGNTRIIARARYGDVWGSPVERILVAGSQSMRVSELAYKPMNRDEDTFDRNEYEFIELENFGEDPLNLDGMKFIDGIEFQFGPVVVDAGGRVLIVKSLEAFAERYGMTADILIAGEFDGQLDNEGERIVFVDAAGRVLFDFIYEPSSPWPDVEENDGGSMVRDFSVTDPANGQGWRWAGDPLGTPGYGEKNFVEITRIRIVGNTIEFDVDTANGGVLVLETTNDIDPANWQEIEMSLLERTMAGIIYSIKTNELDATQFFRIRRTP